MLTNAWKILLAIIFVLSKFLILYNVLVMRLVISKRIYNELQEAKKKMSNN